MKTIGEAELYALNRLLLLLSEMQLVTRTREGLVRGGGEERILSSVRDFCVSELLWAYFA